MLRLESTPNGDVASLRRMRFCITLETDVQCMAQHDPRCVRLAPLYDLASALPYENIDRQRVKVSMKIGGEYRFRFIVARHWRKLAGEVHIDPDKILGRILALAAQLPDHAAAIERRMTAEGMNHPLIPRLTRGLVARAEACRRILG
jgi:serine/threonine-protein kinase HipA